VVKKRKDHVAFQIKRGGKKREKRRKGLKFSAQQVSSNDCKKWPKFLYQKKRGGKEEKLPFGIAEESTKHTA